MSDVQQWREAVDQLRLLGHPVRLALLDELSKAPKRVTDIQNLLEIRQANVSQHLRVMRNAGLVIDEKRGYYVHYRLDEDTLTAWREDINRLPEAGKPEEQAGRLLGGADGPERAMSLSPSYQAS